MSFFVGHAEEGEVGGKGCFIQAMRILPKVGPNAIGSLPKDKKVAATPGAFFMPYLLASELAEYPSRILPMVGPNASGSLPKDKKVAAAPGAFFMPYLLASELAEFGHKKSPNSRSDFFVFVAPRGLEPRLTGPKRAVLPIRRWGIVHFGRAKVSCSFYTRK